MEESCQVQEEEGEEVVVEVVQVIITIKINKRKCI